jgi:hypothetical protein
MTMQMRREFVRLGDDNAWHVPAPGSPTERLEVGMARCGVAGVVTAWTEHKWTAPGAGVFFPLEDDAYCPRCVTPAAV